MRGKPKILNWKTNWKEISNSQRNSKQKKLKSREWGTNLKKNKKNKILDLIMKLKTN
jgi:hypothetical protein